MKIFKWLLGVVFGIFFSLVVAWTSSYLFFDGVDFSHTLKTPNFMPQPMVFEIVVSITYIIQSLAIARLITRKEFGFSLFLVMLKGFFDVVFIGVMFRGHNVYSATIVMALIFACAMLVQVRFLYKDLKACILYLPITVWASFLLILMIAIAMHN